MSYCREFKTNRKGNNRVNLSPGDKPATGFLDYPEAVLIDMARTQMRGEVAEYYQLDPEVFGEDNDWLKKTETHQYMLVASWWVCTFCHAAEQYCECGGLVFVTEKNTRFNND